MSHLISRILLATVMVPLAAVFDVVLFELTESQVDEYFNHSHAGTWMSNSITAILMLAYWLMLWRKHVKWTSTVAVWTIIALLGSAAGGAAIYYVCAKINSDEGGIVAGLLAFPVLWMFLTSFLWRSDRHRGAIATPAVA
jgi:hypothetical protein